MHKSNFKPDSKVIGITAGVILTSLMAFYLLILFWPQNNPYDTVKVEIPRGSSLSEITSNLLENKVIRNQRSFMLAVKTLGYEKDIPAGRFTLHHAGTNYAIITQLVNGTPVLKRITIFEGYTLSRIAALLETELELKAETFLTRAGDQRLLKKWGLKGTSFEGYLFPDTYLFPEGSAPEDILGRCVEEYRRNMTPELKLRGRELDLSELEVVTLASIIEGEAIHQQERAIISGVYHNRLQRGMKLQADPTIQYLLEDGPRRLLNRDLKIDSPYNTYLHAGLPPGPINNPGKESIQAALYPAPTDYLYFVAKGDGYHSFSRTPEEHQQAKARFQQVRRQARRSK